jgi:peptidoglycan/LPS O-acetylase OafA/YrhL
MLGLDGLRGIAILIVMTFHESGFFTDSRQGVEAYIRWNMFNHGWIAVDLFFVLSGFLISGILLDAVEKIPETGTRGYFGTFYFRRSLRIFPIYFVYLAIAYYIYQVASPGPPVGIAWYILYADNWKPGFGVLDGGFGHLWSLAVEEQFYLLWPLVVLLSGRRRIFVVCVSAIGFALALRAVLEFGYHMSQEGLHRNTFTRIDTFAIGTLATLAVRTKGPYIIQHQGKIWAAATIITLAGFHTITSMFFNTIGWLLLAAGFGLFVAVAARCPIRLLAWTPLRRIGAVSYSMYLFHQLICMKVWGQMSLYLHLEKGKPGLIWHFVFLIVGGLVTYLFAEFTFRFIEGPFNRLKKRFEYGQPIPSAELAVTR